MKNLSFISIIFWVFTYLYWFSLSLSFTPAFFLFLVPDKRSELTYFRVDFLIEIKAIFFSTSDLKQVIVKSFLSDSNFSGSLLQRSLDVISIFIMEPCVKLPPKGNFFNDLSDFFFLLLVVFVFLCFVILDSLLLEKGLNDKFLFISDFYIQLEFKKTLQYYLWLKKVWYFFRIPP